MPDTLNTDVVVVGARCAGAATAMLLGRAGHDVVLLDRAALPSDTTSTHSLVRGGMVQLARWGLLDTVLASGAPPVRCVDFYRYDGPGPSAARHVVKDKAGVDALLAPRRRELDRILGEAAVAAGARLLDRTTVQDVVVDRDGRVTGVRAERQGAPLEVRARLVVGADGVRSRVADRVGAPVLQAHAPGGVCLYTYVAEVAWPGFELHVADRRFAGVFPTHDDQAAVFLMLPAAEAGPLLRAGEWRLDAWRRLLRESVPFLADRVDAGATTAPLRGCVSLPQHVRRAVGPGWALVGDAGYHRDPITAHGMTDAFRDAELLAHAAGRLLDEPGADHDALTDFQRRRDQMLDRTYALTRELAGFPPPGRFIELQTELARALDAEAHELAELPAPPGPAASAA